MPRPQDAAAGTNVCYFVKHEDLQIDLAASAGTGRSGVNRLTGMLRDIIFKGQTANYIVALPTGEDLIVSGTPRAASGASRTTRWPYPGRSGVGSCFPGSPP